MKKTWRSWKKIAEKVGSIQATIIFGAIFILIIIPLSFVLRMVNPTILRGSRFNARKGSYWSKIKKKKFNLEFARKQ